MDKNGTITIGDWYKGMADSPYLGFSKVSNCEVFDSPGIAKIAFSTASSFTTTNLPIASVTDSARGDVYTLTYDGKLYKNGVSIQTGLTSPWDLCIYKDYLFVTYQTVVSCYGPLSSASAQFFANQMTGLTSGYYNKMLVAKDNVLYIANGTQMAKLTDLVAGAIGVAPTTAAYYTSAAMLLPENNAIVTMAEVGIYLLIGTQATNGSFYSRGSNKVANLYLWDKSDTKPSSLAGALNENGVNSIISSGNLAYVSAGTKGNIYVSDTVSYKKIKRIPYTHTTLWGGNMTIYPNAMALNSHNNLLIGASVYSGASDNLGGIWEMDINQSSYPIVFKNQISTGNTGVSNNLFIGFISPSSGDVYTYGWQDGSSYGVDTLAYSTSSGSTIESQLYYVGSRLNRKTFQNLEFLLAKPLASSQSITISYRKNLEDSYTQIGSYTYANLGAVISHNTPALIDDAEILQFKIELAQPTIASVGNNVNLMKVTIW